MKKLVIFLVVLGILSFGSIFSYAEGPWPNPAPPIEPKSVQPPVIMKSGVGLHHGAEKILGGPWFNPVPPFELFSAGGPWPNPAPPDESL